MHLEASWSLLKPLGSLLEASGSFLKPRNQFVPRPLGNLLGSLLEASLHASWMPLEALDLKLLGSLLKPLGGLLKPLVALGEQNGALGALGEQP